MFERYTEKARRTIFFARYQASQAGSPYIEPEHLLLGLLREDRGVAGELLKSVTLDAAMRKLIQRVEEKTSTSVDLPLSPASKRVLAYGAEEAEILAHKNIGTSHLLLGLLREESRAAEFLREHGVEIEALRKHVKRETAAAETESPPAMERIKGVLQRAMGGRFTASRVEDGWRIVESQHHVGGHEIRLTERMLLSEDGKTLHYTVEIHGPDGQEHHHRVEFLVE